MLNPAIAGESWEQEFVALAKGNGLKARRVPGCRPHDAVVNGLKVQCKNITSDADGRIRVGKSYGKGGTRRYKRTDFDVLAINFKGTRLFIPAQMLCGSRGRWPNSIVVRRYWRCRDNWAVFTTGGSCEEAIQQTLWEGCA
jgi:hypothetical protein